MWCWRWMLCSRECPEWNEKSTAQHSTAESNKHTQDEETQILAARLFQTLRYMFNRVKWLNWNALSLFVYKCRIAQNTVSRPAAYLQLTPNFGWIECITSTHEMRQRDARMMKNTAKKSTSTHNKILRSLTHSFTHSSYSIYGSRMNPNAYDDAAAAAFMPRAFSNMKALLCRASFCYVLDRMTLDVCCCVCSKREISFYKWTDGFGILLCAQRAKQQQNTHTLPHEYCDGRKREREMKWENERNTNSWRIMAYGLIVTPLLCAQRMYLCARTENRTRCRMEKRMAGNGRLKQTV